MILFSPKLIFLLALTLASISDAEIRLVEEDLQPPADTRYEMVLHTMSSFDPIESTRLAAFKQADETLLPPDTSLADELKKANDLGFEIILQNGAIESLTREALGSQTKIITQINIGPLARLRYGIKDREDVVRWMQKHSELYQDHPNHYHLDGHPVVTVFNGHQLPPEDWQWIHSQIKANDKDLTIFYHAWFHTMNEAAIKAYMDATDGTLLWMGTSDRKTKALAAYNALKTKYFTTDDTNKYLLYIAHVGYWRPEKGSFRDRNGTKDFRHELLRGIRGGADLLMVESWDDFTETHQIQPSVLNHTTMTEVIEYYTKLGKGEKYHAPGTGFHISHRKEIISGEILDIEIIHLPSEGEQYSCQLQIFDEHQNMLQETETILVDSKDAKAFTFSIPTLQHSNTRILKPQLVINETIINTGTFVRLRAGEMIQNPVTVHRAIDDCLQLEQFAFHPTDLRNSFTARLENNEPIKSIEIIRNDIVAGCLFSQNTYGSMSDPNLFHIAIRWDTPRIYENETVPFSGQINLTNGTVLEANALRGSGPLEIKSDSVTWELERVGSLHDGIGILIQGDSQTKLNVGFTHYNESFEVNLTELQQGPSEHFISEHTAIRTYLSPHPLTLPKPIASQAIHAQLSLQPLPSNIRWDDVYLRVRDKQYGIQESLPLLPPFPESEPSTTIWLWNEFKQTAVSKNVSQQRIDFCHWKMDTPSGRWIIDSGTRAKHGERGGALIRDGRYERDQEPKRVQRDPDNFALQFDGNDIVHFPSLCIPQNGFVLSFEIKPAETNLGKIQTVLINNHIKVSIDESNYLSVRLNEIEGRKRPYTIKSTLPLKGDIWNKVAISHDLRAASISIDTQPAGSFPLEGPRYRVAQSLWIGARVLSGHQMAKAKEGFHGELDNLKITTAFE